MYLTQFFEYDNDIKSTYTINHMQPPREVVMAAYKYLEQVIPSTQRIAAVRIEEVVPLEGPDSGFWRVVLSYDSIGDLPFERKRDFKEFRIQDSDLTVVSMKTADKTE